VTGWQAVTVLLAVVTGWLLRLGWEWGSRDDLEFSKWRDALRRLADEERRDMSEVRGRW
jgi:hypothetical protein